MYNQVIKTLESGGVVLIATDTVYGLAALPADEKAVDRIYVLKERPRCMFLPVMVSGVSDMELLGLKINENVHKLLASELVPGAITFVLGFDDGFQRPDWLKERNEIAVRIPDNSFLLAVLRKTGPLLVTSANRHGRPDTPDNVGDILLELNGQPDFIVEDGKGKETPSTIVNCRYNPPIIERHGAISEEIINNILEK
ncbi:MAG: threonylcarbamoyl-AMP synthase [Bacteroidales bacterium]|jgi:L-threonylcarbamoyladenylate synthase|nr:threonylcarbamoyl-AMP synthase [Bacteroidales bacterium]